LRFDDLPFLTEARQLAQRNFVTGASIRNWASYSESINLPASFAEWQRHLLTDPQTSGGLLIACAQNKAADVRQMIVDAGYSHASIVGNVTSGSPTITVE
jgi:selenide, water dikinase